MVKKGATDLVKQRTEFGMKKYGQPLMTEDGRDSVEDAMQELGDLIQYTFKALLNGNDVTPIKELIPLLSLMVQTKEFSKDDEKKAEVTMDDLENVIVNKKDALSISDQHNMKGALDVLELIQMNVELAYSAGLTACKVPSTTIKPCEYHLAKSVVVKKGYLVSEERGYFIVDFSARDNF